MLSKHLVLPKPLGENWTIRTSTSHNTQKVKWYNILYIKKSVNISDYYYWYINIIININVIIINILVGLILYITFKILFM